MKNLIPFLYLIFLISCSGSAQKNKKKGDKIYTIMKTEVEWKKQLTSMQYFVLREAGTERSFTSPLNNNKENGLYVCAACNTPLYDSNYKFDSGSGWPSFDRAISNNVELDVDYKIGYARTELKCATCGGHLGHSFNDGPKNTNGKRHCINGIALKFVKNNQ